MKNVTQISVLGMGDSESITGMGLIRREWVEIRGNLKYDLIKCVVLAASSSALAYSIRLIQVFRHAPQQDALGYIILAVLIFLSLTVYTALVMFRWVPRQNDPAQPLPDSEATEIIQDIKAQGGKAFVLGLMEAY